MSCEHIRTSTILSRPLKRISGCCRRPSAYLASTSFHANSVVPMPSCSLLLLSPRSILGASSTHPSPTTMSSLSVFASEAHSLPSILLTAVSRRRQSPIPINHIAYRQTVTHEFHSAHSSCLHRSSHNRTQHRPMCFTSHRLLQRHGVASSPPYQSTLDVGTTTGFDWYPLCPLGCGYFFCRIHSVPMHSTPCTVSYDVTYHHSWRVALNLLQPSTMPIPRRYLSYPSRRLC